MAKTWRFEKALPRHDGIAITVVESDDITTPPTEIAYTIVKKEYENFGKVRGRLLDKIRRDREKQAKVASITTTLNAFDFSTFESMI